MDLLDEEIRHLARDLGLTEDAARKLAEADAATQAPEPEPAVPSIYRDCLHPYLSVGYSVKPPNTRILRFESDEMSFEESVACVESLVRNGVHRVYGQPFWTRRFWCFYVY